MLPAWRIYYADGTVWDDSDGPWEKAPLDGVVLVARRVGNGVSFEAVGADLYRMSDGEIILGSYEEIGTWVRNLRPDVKFGVGLSRQHFERIVKRARGEFS